MKKRNALIATIIAAGVLTAVPLLHAGPGGHRGKGGPGGGGMFFGHLKHVQEELNLSEAQVNQIRGIFAELHTQNQAYREQAHGGFHSVAAALLQNPNDLSGAQAVLDQQAAAERAMKANRLAATSKALNVLTADQRAELATIIEERGAKRRERRSTRQ